MHRTALERHLRAARLPVVLLAIWMVVGGGSGFALDVSYTESGKLLASDGGLGDEFGSSSDLDGDTLIVGAWLARNGPHEAGTATIFERDAQGSFREVAILLAPDAGEHDHFGSAVAVSGEWAIVGAIDADAPWESAGAAYLFERDRGGPDNWGFAGKLTAVDGHENAWLGASVDISGDTAIVGALGDNEQATAAGAAYVFQRDAGGPSNWGQVAKLMPVDGGSWDAFGGAVGISGDWVVVGASGNDDAETNAGAAYVHARHAGGADRWGLVTKLLADDASGDPRAARHPADR